MPRHARPLDEEQVADREVIGLAVAIGGRFYDAEDCFRCDECSQLTPDPCDLDEEGLCRSCAEWAREDREHQEDLRAAFRR